MNKNKFIIVLFILGILIFSYPYISQFVNNKLQERQVQQFNHKKEELNIEEATKYLKNAEQYNESIFKRQGNFQDPFAKDFNEFDYEDRVVEDENELISTIEIPTMNLSIPIYLGTTETSLSKGVGQVEGTSLPVGGKSTHTVLAGHRGMGTKEMFRNLDELNEGDTFFIHTLKDTLKYKVYKTDVVLPHETEELEVFEDKDLASLITCHPYRQNSHRLVIYGERIK
ncbi:MAG TPA: class C sortase [Pseudogracilibacillus sp.]|nr:class C sortase [Pseudogracilibacillus sp.]